MIIIKWNRLIGLCTEQKWSQADIVREHGLLYLCDQAELTLLYKADLSSEWTNGYVTFKDWDYSVITCYLQGQRLISELINCKLGFIS